MGTMKTNSSGGGEILRLSEELKSTASNKAKFDLRVSNNSSNTVNKTLNLELVYLVRDPTLPYNS